MARLENRMTLAYEATYEVDGGNAETILVGAPNLAAAARKAHEQEQEKPRKELVRIEKTKKVIL